MPETVAHCPLCNSSRQSLFDETQFKGIDVTNQICNQCGFVFQSPHMTSTELDSFYAGEYRSVYQGSEGPNPKDLKTQKGRADHLLDFTKKYIDQVSNHLDIGCSAGILLREFQTHYHCNSVGVEPGDAYRTYAQSKGVLVYADINEVMAGSEEKFDLVSMAHVLEHLPDPVDFLTQLREQLMKPEGYLLVEVPNLYSHDCFEIAHMSCFSPHTLRETLIKSGFMVRTLVKHGYPKSPNLPLYVTALSKIRTDKIPISIRPESYVKQKREFGILKKRVMLRFFPNKTWNKFDDEDE
jgi:SAM-dependent methyltransferase